MARGNVLQPVFKSYSQQQAYLLPPSLEELIAANHPVRVVNEVLNKIDIQPLMRQYKTGGSSSYHPLVLLKVLVYGYVNNVYSSRKLEAAVQENIHYMWLAGMNKPDHNTINRFRSGKLVSALRNIFTQVVLLLAEEGLLSIKELYTDGTKIEANANKYSFVWGKSITHHKAKIQQQLDALWQYAQSVAAAELDDTDPSGFDTIDSEKVSQTIAKIDAALADKPISKTVQQKLNYAKKHWPAALDKYEQQEAIKGEHRNSYSKTDTDATFMRMKDDHMKNGQLKPAYNVQISTNNQYIANYSLHHNATDTNTLIEHVHQYQQSYGQAPSIITADAGYGAQENYQYLQDKGITNYVKYNQFDREQNDTIQSKTPFSADKLFYNEQGDFYVCPMGQTMHNKGTHKSRTTTGYQQIITTYEAKNCSNCPLNGACHKAKGNRQISVNHALNQHKEQARQNLQSEQGIYHRKKRCYDVEPVFANWKHNHQFKRFMLRGKDKVTTEIGLLSLAQNLRKKASQNIKMAA